MSILVPTPGTPLVDRSSRQQALDVVRYEGGITQYSCCTDSHLQMNRFHCPGVGVGVGYSPFLDSRFEMNPSHHPGALYRPHCRFFENQHKVNILFRGIIIVISNVHSHRSMISTFPEGLTGLSMEVDRASIPGL